MKRYYSLLIYLCMLLAGGMSMSRAEDVRADDQAADEPTIAVEKRPGDNMCIEDTMSPYRVIASLSSPIHNMWSGRFIHLKTDKPTTIGWNMVDQDGGINKGDVTKWMNLKPVVCEGDDSRWDAFQYWVKNADGVWECVSDPFRKGQERFAGKGKVPTQAAIPTEITDAYLDPTGKYFQCWRETDSEVVPALNTYRAICQFHADSATLAMRIPFRYSYLQSFIDKLGKANMSGVFVDTIGTTAQGRKLQVIRLEDVTSTAKSEEQKTVLMVSAEHASEASSIWTNYGALVYLLQDVPDAKRLRKDTKWLFVLLEDPDGTENITFDNLTDRFYRSKNLPTPTEVLAYARYFTDYIAAGQGIDVVVSLHNVEANECSHTFSPFRDMAFQDEIVRFNRAFFARLQQEGYRPEQPDRCWNAGAMTFRLFGWLADRFGAFDLCYEVNDRYPPQRLTLAQLQGIGHVLVEELGKWTDSPEGQQHHRSVNERLTKHREARTQYLKNKTGGDGERSPHELLTLGF